MKTEIIKRAAVIGVSLFLLTTMARADVPVEDLSANFNTAEAQQLGQNQDGSLNQPIASAAQQANSANGNATQATNSQDPAQLLSRLDAMQQEIEQLRGKVEVQAHDLKLLSQQQQTFYKDLDQRLAQLSNKTIAVTPAAAKSSPAMSLDTASAPATANKPATKADPQSNASIAGNALVSEAADQGAYVKAFQLIRNKQFNQAIPAMEQFVKQYPNSQFVANGQYWLGELYLAQGKTDNAITSFNVVIDKYPTSSKLSAAMLKLGFALYDKGQLAAAKTELQKVTSKFPDSAVAKLAQTRLDAMQSLTTTTN